MRLFQIIIEITWLILGICCVYLGVRPRAIPAWCSSCWLLSPLAWGPFAS